MLDPTSAYQRLYARTTHVVRKVVQLHKPVADITFSVDTPHRWVCQGCESAGYNVEDVDWPCVTTKLIAQEVGVDLY